MRFGAMNYPIAPVLEEIEAIGRLNMDFVELTMDAPQAHFRQLRQQKKRIVALLDRFGLGLACHLPTFVYIAHLTDAIRQASVEETISSLETAADLGAEKAVVHPGCIDGLAVHIPDQAVTFAMESLEQIYMRAQSLGVTLCLENMLPQVGPFADPEDLLPIFNAFPRLKWVLDTGHANVCDPNGSRIKKLTAAFGDRLEHIHVSDNSGDMDEHLPVGRGTIDFKSLAGILHGFGYDRTMTLEIFNTDRSALVESRLRLEKIL